MLFANIFVSWLFLIQIGKIEAQLSSTSGETSPSSDDQCPADPQCTDTVEITSGNATIFERSISVFWQTKRNCHKDLKYQVTWNEESMETCGNLLQVEDIDICGISKIQVAPQFTDGTSAGTPFEVDADTSFTEVRVQYLYVFPSLIDAEVTWEFDDPCNRLAKYKISWNDQNVEQIETNLTITELKCNDSISIRVSALDKNGNEIGTFIEREFSTLSQDPEICHLTAMGIRLGPNTPVVQLAFGIRDPCGYAITTAATVGGQRNTTSVENLFIYNQKACSTSTVYAELLNEDDQIVASTTRQVETAAKDPTFGDVSVKAVENEVHITVIGAKNDCPHINSYHIVYNSISRIMLANSSMPYVIKFPFCTSIPTIDVRLRNPEGTVFGRKEFALEDDREVISDASFWYAIYSLHVRWQLNETLCRRPNRIQVDLTQSGATVGSATLDGDVRSHIFTVNDCSEVTATIKIYDESGEQVGKTYTMQSRKIDSSDCPRPDGIVACSVCIFPLLRSIQHSRSNTLCRRTHSKASIFTLSVNEEYPYLVTFMERHMNDPSKYGELWIGLVRNKYRSWFWSFFKMGVPIDFPYWDQDEPKVNNQFGTIGTKSNFKLRTKTSQEVALGALCGIWFNMK